VRAKIADSPSTITDTFGPIVRGFVNAPNVFMLVTGDADFTQQFSHDEESSAPPPKKNFLPLQGGRGWINPTVAQLLSPREWLRPSRVLQADKSPPSRGHIRQEYACVFFLRRSKNTHQFTGTVCASKKLG